MKISIINGPNLNLLGTREISVYGEISFEEYLSKLRSEFNTVDIDYFQSNIEGELIDQLHDMGFSANGIILNAGGYTHTSVAISDAVKAIESPVVEVHISNILSREDYRHVSLIGANALGSVIGFGLESYRMALNFLVDKLS